MQKNIMCCGSACCCEACRHECLVGAPIAQHNAKNSINNNNTNGAIFMDVGTLDQCRELHLVCHVIRIGKMTSNQGSSLSTNPITVISGSGGMDGKKSYVNVINNN